LHIKFKRPVSHYSSVKVSELVNIIIVKNAGEIEAIYTMKIISSATIIRLAASNC
jgi:hypothetical protein